MGYSFMRPEREQGYLMPPDLRDWLAEDDLARFIVDVVAELDLKAFYALYREDGWGHPAFHPEMVGSLLVYAYCIGERSSRQIERLCGRDNAFRYITGNKGPDHTTIARFRKDHEEALAALFTQVLRVCQEAGLVQVGVVAVDGTKMKGNAALSANRSREQLEAEVRRMLAEAEAKDAEEDGDYGPEQRGDELPPALRDPRSRAARVQAAAKQVAEQDAAVHRAQEEKLAARRAEEAATGHKKRGRKPRAPEEMAPQEPKVNVTDPESRIMQTRQGYVQGYNAQAAVAAGQIIVAADVTDEANDVRQLHPMLEQVPRELRAAGATKAVGSVLYDAGYWSEANMAQAPPDGPELLVATTKDWKQRKALRERGGPRGRIPQGLSRKERMARKLLTQRGRALYRLRSSLAEPPFGQIKDGRGYDRFLRRGKQAARSAWRLICATHNLLKLHRARRSPRGHGDNTGPSRLAARPDQRRVRLGPLGFRCGMRQTDSLATIILVSPWPLHPWLWLRP